VTNLPLLSRIQIKKSIRSLINRQICLKFDLGNFDRIKPVSTVFGFDRGTPIDRYYIEKFLVKNQADIHGVVLEIGDSGYTKKFGKDKITRLEILHTVPGNSHATIIGDLSTGEGIPENAFDCMILTQTFQFIYDMKSAVRHSYAALLPGGVMLVTVPGISQISRYDMDRWGDYWRFTTLSAQKIFEEVFPEGSVEIDSHGNVLSSIAFLHGLSLEEIDKDKLDFQDPDYQMLITVRAQKPKTEE
jgi:hypothetical protein